MLTHHDNNLQISFEYANLVPKINLRGKHILAIGVVEKKKKKVIIIFSFTFDIHNLLIFVYRFLIYRH